MYYTITSIIIIITIIIVVVFVVSAAAILVRLCAYAHFSPSSIFLSSYPVFLFICCPMAYPPTCTFFPSSIFLSSYLVFLCTCCPLAYHSKQKFNVSARSLRVLNEGVGDDELAQMGITEGRDAVVRSSFAFDHITADFGPGASAAQEELRLLVAEVCNMLASDGPPFPVPLFDWLVSLVGWLVGWLCSRSSENCSSLLSLVFMFSHVWSSPSASMRTFTPHSAPPPA